MNFSSVSRVFSRISLAVLRTGLRLPVTFRHVAKKLIFKSGIGAYIDESIGWPLSYPLHGCRMLGAGGRAYATGGYEASAVQVIMDVVNPGCVCLDVGAHQGYFTLLLSRLVGQQGHVYAFEAHPQNALLLQRNIQLNSFQQRVTVKQIAVTDGGELTIALYAGRGDSSTEWNIVGHDVTGQPTLEELQVPAASLDGYIQAGQPVDFVKMDIEGAEGLALAGMRNLLRNQRPTLLVEFHNSETWAARAELLSASYDLWSLEGTQRIKIAPGDEKRAYHCLAVPKERLGIARSHQH
ncbi:FkbM family methyltransferase [Candidatus Chloroploca sp. M-50]|uniref:FkbM family methyltransferase n=1 Tax=Candidatus Chloroploca mongolica TaxID=2528176 RepID=A0ABS4D8G8_9CHLR|nr:FkbM family methyltransferase [Candidatus Chloroploca mongolica]MBP1465732.1 FkbM family methyltransferase [Candidatus Chloroploca mongolica]